MAPEFRSTPSGKRGNSGVVLRAPLKGDPAYDGFEMQITDPRYELEASVVSDGRYTVPAVSGRKF